MAQPTNIPVVADAKMDAAYHSDVVLAFLVVCFVICALLIVFYNLSVMRAVYDRESRTRMSSNPYMLSLFISQLLVGLIVIPSHIATFYTEQNQTAGFFACRLSRFMFVGASLVGLFNIALIAAKAYRKAMLDQSAVRPFTSQNQVRIPDENDVIVKVQSVRAGNLGQSAQIAGIWIIAFLYATRALVGTDHVYNPHGIGITNVCTAPRAYLFIEKYFVIVDVCFGYIGPFAIIINCYAKVSEKMSLLAHQGYASNDKYYLTVKMCCRYIIMYGAATALSRAVTIGAMWNGGVTVSRNEGFDTVYGLLDAFTFLVSYCASWVSICIVCHYNRSCRNAIRHTVASVPVLNRCCTPEPDETVEEVHV